jgi:hypothetical protein
VLRRLITDPLTGHLLDRAETTYRPSQGLRDFVKTRDQECWWPGCHARARVCDEDHKIRFPDGPTSRINVGALCEHHHQLKHSGEWHLRVRPDGTVELTGPDGHTRHIPYPRLCYEPVDDGPDDPGSPVEPGPEPRAVADPDDDPPF